MEITLAASQQKNIILCTLSFGNRLLTAKFGFHLQENMKVHLILTLVKKTLTFCKYYQLHSNLIQNNLMHPSVTVEHGLQVLDVNNDGRISFNEFMRYLDTIQQ